MTNPFAYISSAEAWLKKEEKIALSTFSRMVGFKDGSPLLNAINSIAKVGVEVAASSIPAVGAVVNTVDPGYLSPATSASISTSSVPTTSAVTALISGIAASITPTSTNTSGIPSSSISSSPIAAPTPVITTASGKTSLLHTIINDAENVEREALAGAKFLVELDPSAFTTAEENFEKAVYSLLLKFGIVIPSGAFQNLIDGEYAQLGLPNPPIFDLSTAVPTKAAVTNSAPMTSQISTSTEATPSAVTTTVTKSEVPNSPSSYLGTAQHLADIKGTSAAAAEPPAPALNSDGSPAVSE